jgi:hypothetical protein
MVTVGSSNCWCSVAYHLYNGYHGLLWQKHEFGACQLYKSTSGKVQMVWCVNQINISAKISGATHHGDRLSSCYKLQVQMHGMIIDHLRNSWTLPTMWDIFNWHCICGERGLVLGVGVGVGSTTSIKRTPVIRVTDIVTYILFSWQTY